MATDSGQELDLMDLTRLVVIVLSLIVGGIFFRTFFHNYVSEPARAAAGSIARAERHRTTGTLPLFPREGPASPFYEQAQLMHEYVITGDKQAKQRVIQNAKKRSRAKHSLAIWGSLAVACVSILALVGAGLPMLLKRRA